VVEIVARLVSGSVVLIGAVQLAAVSFGSIIARIIVGTAKALLMCLGFNSHLE
jgi:hypothetical protein